MNNDDTVRWSAKHDAFRTTTDFSDLLRIVACYYEMYSRAATFIGPWIARQSGLIFMVPEKEQVKEALGKERKEISFRARAAFIEGLLKFIGSTKGKKTLIHPNPSTHHSAQFPSGTFEIKELKARPVLKDEKGVRKESKTLHSIEFAGAAAPVYVENLLIAPSQIQFIILRPKMGKLGTPSTSRWEVLLYKKGHGYLIEHVDSDLNPRWSGIM